MPETQTDSPEAEAGELYLPRITFRLEEKLDTELRIAAARRRCSIQKLCIDAIKAYLEVS